MSRRLLAITSLSLALGLAACSTTSPDVVSRQDAQRMATIVDAVVLSSRPVVVEGSQSGVGATTGAVIGGIAGSTRSSGREQVAIGVLGAVVGGIVGNAAERFGTREEALEILVQLKSGERRSVVQAKGSESFNPGDSVILVSTGGKVRVTRAPGTTPSGATAPAADAARS